MFGGSGKRRSAGQWPRGVGVGVAGGAADRHRLGQLPAPVGELLVQTGLPRPVRRDSIASPQTHRVVGHGDGGTVVRLGHGGEAGQGAPKERGSPGSQR